MALSEGPESRHVAVLAFPFGGHTRPMLGLVCSLAMQMPHARFSFFTTARLNEQIFSEGEYDVPSNIKPYDVADGVPMDHAFSGNPHEPANIFIKAAPGNYGRAVEFAVLETGKKITSILADSFLPFAEEMAEEMRIPWVSLWIAMPYTLYVYMFLDDICSICSSSSSSSGHPRDGEEAPEIIHGVPAMRIEDLPEGVIDPGDLEGCVLLSILDNIHQTLPRATAAVINFCQELDPTPLTNYLSTHYPSFLFLGFLTLSVPPPRPDFRRKENCLSWLDKHDPGSVAYISFGTLAVLDRDEMLALAGALEECKITYLWSLRDKENLPEGFLEKTAANGMVVPWAPQVEVLGHPSIGAFVTHAGSNSVYESIAGGVPMICRPFFGEQRMAGRMVSEVWEIGLTVENGVMTKDSLIGSFKFIFGDESGRKIREKAQALKELLKVASGPNGKAARELKVLVDILA